MHNLGDDKELDRLSRDAAGRYTPPGGPDWQTLSAELDKVMPVEKKKRRFLLFWWLLPLLLAGGATAYWFGQKNNETPVAEQTAVVAPAQKEIPATGSNKKTEQEPESTTARVSVNQPSAAPSHSIRNETAVAPAVPQNTIEKKQAAFVKTNSSVNSTHAIAEKLTTEANTTVVTQNSPTTKPVGETGKNAVADPAKENTVTATVPAKGSEAITAQPQKDPTVENKTEPATIAPEKNTAAEEPVTPKKSNPLVKPGGKGMSLGLLTGVDESTVKFKYGNKAGYNLGITIGYHFNNKLSIHTGAVYTQKNYKVAGEDFTAPKGSWASYYKLETITGYCRMWEVPLVARYTISQGKRNSVFLSTGLSSYFMSKEYYDYTYLNNAGVLTTRNITYNSADSYVLSILHLSAGFENRVSKNISLLIEPYAKLPLNNVGLGNIRLSSFGLNFSVQYRQPAKK